MIGIKIRFSSETKYQCFIEPERKHVLNSAFQQLSLILLMIYHGRALAITARQIYLYEKVGNASTPHFKIYINNARITMTKEDT